MVEDCGTRRSIVCLEWADLVAGKNFRSEVQQAFGPDGLGILAVCGISKEELGTGQLRSSLLPLAQRFARLPANILRLYEHEQSKYAIGWSRGKEKLQDGNPDFMKGSFYANPQHDRPVDDPYLIETYPEFVHPNIWPKEHLPDLEPAFKNLGMAILEVGRLVANQCDAFLKEKLPSHTDEMERIVTTSRCCKGRLLYYYALGEQEEQREEFKKKHLWCGWHSDHCLLTGLCPGMMLDASGKDISFAADSTSGLYVMSRSGDTYRITLPTQDCFLFQIGETAEIISDGALHATPHCVRAPMSTDISRASFAVFMEPEWDYNLPLLFTESKKLNSPPIPSGCVPLTTRFQPGMTFGDFTKATYGQFYDG
jgi:isopenicillin N synthase-like dioxygenase